MIGILYVGIPQVEFIKSVFDSRNTLTAIGGIVTVLAAFICLLATSPVKPAGNTGDLH